MNLEIDYLWSHKCPKKWDQYTLIALVITTVVLLILAGVTIVTLTGDNGLLQKAQTAKEENEEAKELELIKLAVSAAQVAGKGTITKDNLESELKINFNDNKETFETNELFYYKGYRIYKDGKVEEGRLLPDEYQQVEYLESTGTQYIDTGIPSQPNLKIITNVASLNNDIYMIPIGCNWALYLQFNKGYIGFGNTISIKSNIEEFYSVIIEEDSNRFRHCKCLGEEIIAGSASTRNHNIYLFGLNDNNTLYRGSGLASNVSAAFHGRMKNIEIYIGENLVKELVVCYRKRDNKPGLYDAVNGQFYENQGTGTFGYGMEDGTYVAPQ